MLTKAPIPVVICGVTGRMGRAILQTLEGHAEFSLQAGLSHRQSALLGQDLGLLHGGAVTGLQVQCTWELKKEERPVIIDFSTANATADHLAMAIKANCPIVVGSTGHDK